jgi:hypothetical protein
VLRPIRARLASILVVLAVLFGLLALGVATAHQGAGPLPDPAVAAPPLHPGEVAQRDQDPGLRALAERGRRHGPAPRSAPVAMLAGALLLAGLSSLIGAWRGPARAGLRGRPRRTWSRAPPSHLQPV